MAARLFDGLIGTILIRRFVRGKVKTSRTDSEINVRTVHAGTLYLGAVDMKRIQLIVSRLIKDEQGGEVLEYALIAGLIVVAAIAVITSVGGKVLARWQSLNSSM